MCVCIYIHTYNHIYYYHYSSVGIRALFLISIFFMYNNNLEEYNLICKNIYDLIYTWHILYGFYHSVSLFYIIITII